MAQIGRPRTNDTATHCQNDHELTPENTYVYPEGTTNAGKRVCKVCRRNSQQKYKGRPISGDVPIGVWNRNKTHCPAEHPYEKFGRLKNDGSRFCTICHRVGRVRRTYGLTLEQWDALVLKQEGRCAICLAEHGDLHVDHEHSSGRVRGLLCTRCNNGIGRFKDDSVRLCAAAAYVGGLPHDPVVVLTDRAKTLRASAQQGVILAAQTLASYADSHDVRFVAVPR